MPTRPLTVTVAFTVTVFFFTCCAAMVHPLRTTTDRQDGRIQHSHYDKTTMSDDHQSINNSNEQLIPFLSPKVRSLRKHITSHSHLMRQQSSPSPSPSFNASNLLAYAMAPCSYHDDCYGDYLCLTGNWESSCSGQASCTCVPLRGFQRCDGNCSKCNNYPFETCAYRSGDDQPGKNITVQQGTFDGICASTLMVYVGLLVELGDCKTFDGVGFTPMPAMLYDDEDEYEDEWKWKGQGEEDYDVDITVSPTPSPIPSSTTITSSSSSSSSSITTEEDSTPSPIPSSTTVTSSPSPSPSITTEENKDDNDDEDVCIAVDMLSHLPTHALVFGNGHRRAAVLCDTFNSCATPGHIVVHSGHVMTMRQYCEYYSTGCKRRVTLVNSPRLRHDGDGDGSRRRVRVRSKTPDMEMTAFAARFDTMAERVMLRLLVNVLGF